MTYEPLVIAGITLFAFLIGAYVIMRNARAEAAAGTERLRILRDLQAEMIQRERKTAKDKHDHLPAMP